MSAVPCPIPVKLGGGLPRVRIGATEPPEQDAAKKKGMEQQADRLCKPLIASVFDSASDFWEVRAAFRCRSCRDLSVQMQGHLAVAMLRRS